MQLKRSMATSPFGKLILETWEIGERERMKEKVFVIEATTKYA